jgi:hypothetical protein
VANQCRLSTTTALPAKSTATHPPEKPAAATWADADQRAPFQRSELPLPSTATALNDGPFSALRLVYADDRAHRPWERRLPRRAGRAASPRARGVNPRAVIG